MLWLASLVEVIENRIRRNYLQLQLKIDPPPKVKRGESGEHWLMRIDLKYAIRNVELLKLLLANVDEDFIEEQAKGYAKEKREAALEIAKRFRNLREFNERTYSAVMDRKYIEEEFDLED